MISLSICHTTVYRYSAPVHLGPHRMMLRPRESRELRLLSMQLEVEPQTALSWAQDVTGNVVATAAFPSMSDQLVIRSSVELELDAMPWPVFDISASAASYPFRYSNDELADLGALVVPQYHDPTGRLREWTRGFVRGVQTDTLALLKDINAGVLQYVSYQSRDAEGTQSPSETLTRGWGSCRDLAILFIDALRTLGLGARIVSGYLYNPTQVASGSSDAGSTHAWAEVYLPGAGWITFDPTNRSVGGANLIPVAVGRGIAQVMPVSGSYTSLIRVGTDMTVGVTISASSATSARGGLPSM